MYVVDGVVWQTYRAREMVKSVINAGDDAGREILMHSGAVVQNLVQTLVSFQHQ